jgi:nickel superoxide dismutase
MIHKILSKLNHVAPLGEARAHCDIPCKIYDPSTAIIAALSVVRLIDIISEVEPDGSIESLNTITRCVVEKEKEAEKVKHEIRVIWGDYIKAPQVEAHPNVNQVVHDIMLKASACKQNTDRAHGEALVELVNQFAEIFWQTKNIKTARKQAPYPPSLVVVYPDL